MQESPDDVILSPPEEGGLPGGAEELLDAVKPERSDPFFALEAQLRDFLASNLASIPVDGKMLRLFVDAEGRDGVEYPSGVGPIDILAVDGAGDFFVLELKRADSSDRAVGQLARYMGWIGQTIGAGRQVFGVIVSQTVSSNLRYAASIIPNVRLFEYRVNFQLTAAHDLMPR